MTNYNRYQPNEEKPTNKQREKLFLCMQQILRLIINNKTLFKVDEDKLLYEAETHIESIMTGEASVKEPKRLYEIFRMKKKEYAWRQLSELMILFLQLSLRDEEHFKLINNTAHRLSMALKYRLKHKDLCLKLDEANEEWEERQSLKKAVLIDESMTITQKENQIEDFIRMITELSEAIKSRKVNEQEETGDAGLTELDELIDKYLEGEMTEVDHLWLMNILTIHSKTYEKYIISMTIEEIISITLHYEQIADENPALLDEIIQARKKYPGDVNYLEKFRRKNKKRQQD